MTAKRFADFPSPPRSVALGLRCKLLTNVAVLLGGVFFLFGSIFTIVFGSATNPTASLQLARSHQEAPGRVTAVVKTSFSEGVKENSPGTPIYRNDFTFRLPDRREITGASYTVGEHFKVQSVVTVEYVPSRPETSRIKGTRTAPYGGVVLFVLIFPLIGLVVMLGGFAHGYQRIRLLRHGLLADATLVGCRSATNLSGPELLPEEFRQRMKDAVGAVFPGANTLAASGAKGLLIVWKIVVIGFLIFGNILIVFWFGVVLSSDSPAKTPFVLFGFVLFGIIFAVVWNLMGFFFLRTGKRMGGIISGKQPSELAQQLCSSSDVKIRFTFQSRDGRTIQAEDTTALTSVMGDEPTEPVLYDPRKPQRVFLLDGLSLPLRVTRFGGWEAPTGILPFLRMAFVIFCLTGPFIGWAIWSAGVVFHK